MKLGILSVNCYILKTGCTPFWSLNVIQVFYVQYHLLGFFLSCFCFFFS